MFIIFIYQYRLGLIFYQRMLKKINQNRRLEILTGLPDSIFFWESTRRLCQKNAFLTNLGLMVPSPFFPRVMSQRRNATTRTRRHYLLPSFGTVRFLWRILAWNASWKFFFLLIMMFVLLLENTALKILYEKNTTVYCSLLLLGPYTRNLCRSIITSDLPPRSYCVWLSELHYCQKLCSG